MLAEGLTEHESEVMSVHFDYLKGLMEKGVLILAGRTLNTDMSSFGLAIINAESEEVARRIMKDDPAVKEHVMRGELYPYRVALIRSENV